MIATGFEVSGIDNENFLIEFYGDDGKTFNTQVITPDVLRNMPKVFEAGCKLYLSNEIPENPADVYKDEWKGWADFLGKDLSECNEEELKEMLALETDPKKKDLIKRRLLELLPGWAEFVQLRYQKN